MASPLPSPAAARVGVVTVSYGSGAVLSPLLRSLEKASVNRLAVVVADNRANEPESVADIAAEHGVGYVAMDGNRGYGAAINAATASLPPGIEWILVVNPDVVLLPGSIDELVAAGDADAAIGSVGPQTRTLEGNVYPSARAVPSLRTGVGHALFVNLWLENPWTRAYRNDVTTEPIRRDAGWLSGACGLVRRAVFDELGGFDEGYFMYFEDVDLGYRIGKAGYRNVYEPSAVATHTGAHSTNSDSDRMIAAHHESARRFLNRKYAGIWLWPVRVTLTIGLQLRSALVRRRANRQ